MERVVIRNGRVLDPQTGIDGAYNIYVMGGRIASIKKAEEDTSEVVPGSSGLTLIDATGLLVVPGFIDLHTHLREPGYEYKETIETGTLAAAAGGFTSVFCMANTNPVNDSEPVTRHILEKAGKACGVNVFPVGAITQGLKGERLTEMAELKAAGCRAVSDDGAPVKSAGLMRRALEYSALFGMPVISHAEEPDLVGAGVMNEGAVATRLGLKGIPNAAEDTMVARDISLAELTSGRLHVAHVSTKGAVELIRAAKARGVKVTAEATPHHLTLTDESVGSYNTNAKMNPPLRSADDVKAVQAGLADGTIDAIATDHAPHSVIEKDVEFDKASNGIIGLETAFSVCYGLVEDGVLALKDLIAALTTRPARAMGLDRGVLKVGFPADIAVIDLSAAWKVEEGAIKSKSKNTPWLGATLKGLAVKTLVSGRVVFDRSK